MKGVALKLVPRVNATSKNGCLKEVDNATKINSICESAPNTAKLLHSCIFPKIPTTVCSQYSLSPHKTHFAMFMEMCGSELTGRIKFKSDEQVKSVICQIIFFLVAARKKSGYSHNDFHKRNILINDTRKETICYKVEGTEYVLKTSGVWVTVIDYEGNTFDG